MQGDERDPMTFEDLGGSVAQRARGDGPGPHAHDQRCRRLSDDPVDDDCVCEPLVGELVHRAQQGTDTAAVAPEENPLFSEDQERRSLFIEPVEGALQGLSKGGLR